MGRCRVVKGNTDKMTSRQTLLQYNTPPPKVSVYIITTILPRWIGIRTMVTSHNIMVRHIQPNTVLGLGLFTILYWEYLISKSLLLAGVFYYVLFLAFWAQDVYSIL